MNDRTRRILFGRKKKSDEHELGTLSRRDLIALVFKIAFLEAMALSIILPSVTSTGEIPFSDQSNECINNSILSNLCVFNQHSASNGTPCTIGKGSITSATCTVTFPTAFSRIPVIDSLYTLTTANNTGNVFTNLGLFQESGVFFKNIPEVATTWGGPNDNRSRAFVDLRGVSVATFSATVYDLSGNCTQIQVGFEYSVDNGVTFNIFPSATNEILISFNPPPPSTNANQTSEAPTVQNILGATPPANQLVELEFVGISLPQDGHHFCSAGISSLNLQIGSPVPFCTPLLGTGFLQPQTTNFKFRMSCPFASPEIVTYNVYWSATNFLPDPVTGH